MKNGISFVDPARGDGQHGVEHKENDMYTENGVFLVDQKGIKDINKRNALCDVSNLKLVPNINNVPQIHTGRYVRGTDTENNGYDAVESPKCHLADKPKVFTGKDGSCAEDSMMYVRVSQMGAGRRMIGRFGKDNDRNGINPLVKDTQSLHLHDAIPYSSHPNGMCADRDLDEEDEKEADGHLMSAEYAKDIFRYLMNHELKFQPDVDYMKRQTEITWQMRSVLIGWLIEVNLKLKLLPETLFLSVNLLDRFLSVRAVSRAKFQLLGITSTLIASKFEEILSPSIENFVHLSDNMYGHKEIIKSECYMLHSLQFNISAPTPYLFLRRISKVDHYDIETRTLSKYFLELSLLDHSLIRFPPSMMAAACFFLSRKILSKGEWDHSFIYYSGGYTQASLEPIATSIMNYTRTTRHDVIFKKYASKRFMRVSMHIKKYLETN